MHTDPLCEVGCPYAVRGFDFDYLGLLWLGDLLWGDGRQSRMGWRRQHGWNAQLENTKVERQSPACSSWSAGCQRRSKWSVGRLCKLRSTLFSTVEVRRTMNFTIESELEDDGRWLAEVPQLPGVLAYGSSRDEAMSRAQVLALRVLAERLEHGEASPQSIHMSIAA
jgi:predicted RNase H-like HicB family nuclease